jgi:hypothetical protein
MNRFVEGGVEMTITDLLFTQPATIVGARLVSFAVQEDFNYELKTCETCGESKDTSEYYIEYYREGDGEPYYRKDCKSCCKAKAKKGYKSKRASRSAENP